MLYGDAEAGLLSFKDHFSERAALYAAYRPEYPKELFDFVANLPQSRRLALDCATGSGQAARGLVAYFDRVIAIDASKEQLSAAEEHPRIEYRVARVEDTGVPDNSVDLVTAAQALHWFDTAAFFREASRVIAPGGAIAVWGYGDPVLDTPELQRIVHRFNRGTVEDYWMPERQILLDGFATIPFPFDEVEAPKLTLSREITLEQLMGYVRSWSATGRFMKEHGTAEVERLEHDLARHWGDISQPRLVEAPLHIRAGYPRAPFPPS